MPKRLKTTTRGIMGGDQPGTGTTVIPATNKPRRRRTRRATAGDTQHLSVARRSAGGTGLATLINEFIAVGQEMGAFKPNLNTQALASVWARIGVHSGLTL